MRRLAPTLLAGVLAAAYVIVSPSSGDLPAHLLRAKLFATEGFGAWNNWWYAGHNTPGYSVLFPPAAALIGPQLAAGLAATGSAAVFESIARHHFGREAWLGALWFGAASATTLFTGRLTFAFGLLPALGAALALQRGRPACAAGLAALSALVSPVEALFAALAGVAHAAGRLAAALDSPRRALDSPPQAPDSPRRAFDSPPEAVAARRRLRALLPGALVAIAGLATVAALAVAFPEGGSEPFAFSALAPIPVIAAVLLFALPRREYTLRAGTLLYLLGCLAAFALPTPVGSNADRLAALLAGPLAALLWWPGDAPQRSEPRRRARTRRRWLLAAALPLLYLQWQAPVQNTATATGDPATSAAYYRPLLSFLRHQAGAPFRIEIPFTESHAESYYVAPQFALARGWERQLDIRDNPLFYGGHLTAAGYREWLRALAVRFVAVPDAKLDYSAQAELALIDRGPPYLRLVMLAAHWRVYAVRDASPIVQGTASLRALGPDSLTLQADRPGTATVRVRFSPYWALTGVPGCVAPDGDFTRVSLQRAGAAKLVIRFALTRIGSRSPRCS